MDIADYLARGGVLTAPGNVPPRYRAELLKIMARFVDSALAGAAGFADVINEGPGIRERIAASRIVLEKTAHAERVLGLMAEFGADVARYDAHHPWTARLDRDAAVGATRSEHDMRLAVFNYPLAGWTDAVVMNLVMAEAVDVQLAELSQLSYQPLADAFRAIAPVERRHGELAREGIARLRETGTDGATLQAAVDYWWPRVAVSFGATDAARLETLRAMGLRRVGNDVLAGRWREGCAARLDALGLRPPG